MTDPALHPFELAPECKLVDHGWFDLEQHFHFRG